MQLQRHIAYNQTSECFLGMDVIAADSSSASPNEWTPALTLKHDAGLWLVPFRGIPESRVQVSVDLIYLDEKCRVIDVDESFPAYRASTSIPPASSVLALPTQSIASSNTRKGDQLILCAAEEMDCRLKHMPISSVAPPDLGSSDSASLSSFSSSGQDVPQLMNGSADLGLRTEENLYAGSVQPKVQKFSSPKNWLKRWLSPDPRKAHRQSISGLSAMFWTGASPEVSHDVSDISSTGMFLLTDERWCRGTVIRILLTSIGNRVENSEHSISVQARVVRWGNDGVGLQFLVQDKQKFRGGQNGFGEGANRSELDEFLRRIGIGGTSTSKTNVA